jgi:hypothetical protein
MVLAETTIMLASWIIYAAAIFGAGIALAALGEYVCGARRITLPLGFLLLMSAAGGAMSVRCGWASALLLLGAYGALCVGEGLRVRARRDQAPGC